MREVALNRRSDSNFHTEKEVFEDSRGFHMGNVEYWDFRDYHKGKGVR